MLWVLLKQCQPDWQGPDKYAKVTFKRGRPENTRNLDMDTSAAIKELEQEGSFNGVNGGDSIQHTAMKEMIPKE